MDPISLTTRVGLNIDTVLPVLYRDSHHKDKTVLQLSYHIDGLVQERRNTRGPSQ